LIAAFRQLPSEIAKVCETFVLVYGKDVIEWIVDQGKNPRQVCQKLNLCSNFQVAVPADTKCDICVFVVSYAAKYINGTEEQIEKVLLGACKKLPGQLEKICETLVLTYGKDIIRWLLAKVQPKEICTRIGLCKNSTVAMSPKLDTCTYCVYVIEYASKFINGSKEEIQKQLIAACRQLPAEIAKICETFVLVYGKDVIEWIVDQGKNPRQVCQKLNLCSLSVQKRDEFCTYCVYVIEYASKFINGSKEEIQKQLIAACRQLPSEIAKVCETFVLVYGKDVIEWIVDQGKNPRQVCQKLNLCSLSVQKRDEFCTYCIYVIEYASKFING
jgi:hypothetical protein